MDHYENNGRTFMIEMDGKNAYQNSNQREIDDFFCGFF